MKCQDCKYFKNIANTDETGQGICGFPISFFPTQVNNECAFLPKPYTCKDCDRFANDTACMTAAADDLVEREYGMCGGFVDKRREDVYHALMEWKLRGFDIDEKLHEVLDEVNEFKAPWEATPEKEEN